MKCQGKEKLPKINAYLFIFLLINQNFPYISNVYSARECHKFQLFCWLQVLHQLARILPEKTVCCSSLNPSFLLQLHIGME